MAIIETPEFSRFRITLADLLSTDNDIRNKAEELYEEIPSNDKIFLLLAAAGSDGISPEEAELAAVLLRRLFCQRKEAEFSKLSPDAQIQIKSQILHLLQQNTERNLRKKIGDAAAELARYSIDDEGNNHWPEFLKFLFEAACSQDPVLKEASLLMFSQVPGVFGNQQARYIDVIHQMLVRSLTDESCINVRYAATKATSSFMLAHEKETAVQKQFNNCINLLIQFLSQVLDNADEQVEDLLRYMVDLVDSCYQSFRNHIDILFPVCLKAVSSSSCPESCRHLALEVIVTLAEAAPAMVRKLGAKHLPDLISTIFNMIVDIEDDPDWDSDDDNDEEENDSNNIIGEAALDRIACALGGKTILPIVLSSLPLMLQNADWKKRYAGLMTISAVGEGCHKQMSNILSQIVDVVFPYLMDPVSRVRYAACNAIGQMSSDFAPIFQKKFGDKVISGLLNALEDMRSPRVQAHAGAALVNFFEDCPKSVLNPYMDIIALRLEVVLKLSLELFENGTKMVLEQIVVTIAALADCAEEKFINYYDKFMPFLKFIIQTATLPKLRLLRGKTIECISLIGLAVGKLKFINDAGEVMDLLLKSQTEGVEMTDDDPQLSYMIAAWARICKILGKAFEPYLPFVMQPVLRAASVKPEIAVLDAEDMKVVENDEDWEFVNLVGKQNFGIRTTGLEEKATACQMLVCYAKELKEGFAPYVEEVLKLMLPLLKFYFHDSVREAAAEILPHLLESAKVRGDAYVQEMWRYIVTPFLQAIEYEPEPDVLCNEMSAFSQCIEVLSYKCLNHEELMYLINLVIKKLQDHFDKAKARDQKRKEEDYDEVLEEALEREDDDDVYILSKISDIVCTLFATYKQDFFPYFDALLPQYIQLLEIGRSSTDRLWAICVFADVIEYGGHQCTRYQQYFLRPIIQSLNHENVDLRQTAAFAIGCLGQFGGPEFASVCAESLPMLIGVINAPESRSEENIKATENAISAIGKFLMYNNSMINMDEMLPLWISWLPIWDDEEESKFVYNFLCSMLEMNNPLLLGKENCNLPRIVQIVAEAFYKEAIEPTSDVGKRIISLIKDIQNTAELFNICVSTLNIHQQEALHAALTTQ